LAAASVDVLLCGLAIGHVQALTAAMAEISRVLRPDGLALLSDFHPAQFGSGGRRSFRDAEGLTFSVEHYLHTADSLRQAADQVGLSLRHVDEAAVPGAPSPGPAVIVYELLRGLTSRT
jgi:malonyl-CoA O-methyltransferase